MSTNAVKVSSGFTQYPFTTHIGEAGRLFYNAATGELRLSDGHTPGGLPVYTAVGAANIGNLVITNTTIGTYSANANINIQTNGGGIINLVGNIGFFTTAAGITGTPLLTVDNLGNLVVNGRLNVNGVSTFIGNVYHQGYTSFIGDAAHVGNVVITGATTNTGNSTFNGNTVFNGNAYHTGFTSFVGDVAHVGNVVITGATINNGASIFNGDLTIAGNARLVGNTNVTGNTYVTGNTFVTGNTLVTGQTTVAGNTLVTGNTTVVGTTTVTGNTLVTGTTTVTGNTLVTGNTTVVGQTYLTGNSYVTGYTFVTGTTTVTGNTYVTGQVTTITGNTYLQGNSFVTGTISVTGNSIQSGLSTFIVSAQNSTEGAVEITGDSAGGYQAPINVGVMLHITGQYNLPGRVYNDGQNNYPVYTGRRYNGNVTAPSQVLNGQDVVRYGASAYTSGGWFGNGIARMSIVANEDQTLTNQGSRIEFSVTPNGNSSSNIANVAVLTSSLATIKTDTAINGNATITGNVTASNLAINSNGVITTPRVVINDGGLRTVNGGSGTINLNFNTDSIVHVYQPSGAITFQPQNFVAGATINVWVQFVTAYTITYGVNVVNNSTTQKLTLASGAGGTKNNQAVQLVYTCVDGTLANTYVSSSYV